ncbi:MAG: PQQ-binding-like beta-propeller repeat protein [Deltaproteobacteria bacterium]|nr:PQQ-binding-like beta-propeller repeat protein [Deltaproteobacteria bacterium]MBW2387076.1 PQQ-binding-like beta-propeller repeat protein [Deltaproteobacteria bacterium]
MTGARMCLAPPPGGAGWLAPCLILLAAFAAGLAGGATQAETPSFDLHPGYAQTSWPAGHRDSGNTDYVPVVMSRENRIVKHLLKGHPIFWPPLAGPEGNHYVTSGKGLGHSNLHVFDSEGELLWQAAPQRSLDDLDAYAIINAPVVARGGDVYVGDRNQLWAFHPDGQVKWVTDLAPHGVDWGFMTVVISSQGYVGGISSEGKVLFFRPEDGELAMPALDLPGGHGPPAEDTPPGSLWRDLMDPAIKPFMFNLIQGWEMEVANTPAVHPRTGRVYITAAGPVPGMGLLLGIDVHEDRLEIAFQTSMGGGSGTSPAVSHDGERVYALDEIGHMVAVNAYTGEKLWETREAGGGSASPSVGPDGTIYTAFHDHLLAFRPDGSLAWRREYNSLCAEHIPTLSGFWSWIFSKPVAFVDSLFTVAERDGWLNIVCGYHLELLPSRSERTLVPVPQQSLIVAIDLRDGSPAAAPLPIPETSEGFITPTLDGNTFVTLSGAITSIFYHMLNPLLPERLEVPNEPKAGLLLLEPVSRVELAREGLRWLQSRNAAALAALDAGAADVARATLRRARLQLDSTRAVLQRAAADGDAAPELLPRQLALLDQVESIQASIASAIEHRATAGPESSAGWRRAVERVRVALEEIEASLEPAESP